MSIWHARSGERAPVTAHHVTLVDVAIFAAGMIVAMLVGIAASGVIPV